MRKQGDFIPRNVVPACQECDDSKGQKEYHVWMRSADSPKSLRSRGLTEEEIGRRIQRIEKWQAGYQAKSEKQLFGKNYGRYLDILKKMDALNDIKPQNQNTVAGRALAATLISNMNYESSALRVKVKSKNFLASAQTF